MSSLQSFLTVTYFNRGLIIRNMNSCHRCCVFSYKILCCLTAQKIFLAEHVLRFLIRIFGSNSVRSCLPREKGIGGAKAEKGEVNPRGRDEKKG
jgi:hypothetical protein